MQILDSNQINQVSAGNLIVPTLCCLAVGTCSSLVAWAIKTSLNDDTEAFGVPSNYFIEGMLGMGTAALSTGVFIFAT